MPWALGCTWGAPGPWALTLFVCQQPRGIQPKAEIKKNTEHRKREDPYVPDSAASGSLEPQDREGGLRCCLVGRISL